MIDTAAQFGDSLARCRKRADLSQEELSVLASLQRTARIDTLIKLSGSLEVDPDELLAGITWSPGDVRRGAFVDRSAG